jgi:hypothetical protein
MARVDLDAAMARWNALLDKPLFSGPPHRDYARHKLALEIIFSVLFPQWRRDTARTQVYPRVKIPPSVLYEWRAHWEQDPAWRPWDKEANGKHHRAFTDEEEALLAAEIVDNYILPGKQFIGATFRELALAAYASTGRDSEGFKCSQQFIDDFKRRHGFSSRRFHLRRRRQDPGRGDITEWIEHVMVLLLGSPHERIVNCDETMWTVVPNGLLTWAPVGEDGVTVISNACEKEAITALASVTAAHDKLPLFLIAKGKTARVEQTQLGAPDGCVLAHSPSGWTTVDTFHAYLQWLRQFYGDQEPIHLILDCYSVHRSAATRGFAAELGIFLHFIPPGWTDELQPLDRYIFGALKSTCRRLFQRFCMGIEGERIRIADGVQFLKEAWDRLETKVIEAGWGIYEDALGDVSEADDESDGEWVEELEE